MRSSGRRSPSSVRRPRPPAPASWALRSRRRRRSSSSTRPVFSSRAAAWGGAGDADLILLVIDADAGLNRAVERIVESLQERQHPLWIALNKVDIVKKPKLPVSYTHLTLPTSDLV